MWFVLLQVFFREDFLKRRVKPRLWNEMHVHCVDGTMLGMMLGLMRMKADCHVDWLGHWVAEYSSPWLYTVTAHISRHVHAAAHSRWASDRGVSTLVGCTNNTVSIRNARQQRAMQSSVRSQARSLHYRGAVLLPFPMERHVKSQTRLWSTAFRRAGRPSGILEREAGNNKVVPDRTGRSLCRQVALGEALPPRGAVADSSMATSRAPPIVVLN